MSVPRLAANVQSPSLREYRAPLTASTPGNEHHSLPLYPAAPRRPERQLSRTDRHTPSSLCFASARRRAKRLATSNLAIEDPGMQQETSSQRQEGRAQSAASDAQRSIRRTEGQD